MGVKSDYADATYAALIRMHPEWEDQKDEVISIIYSIIDENFKNPTITLDNNVIGEYKTTKLTGLMNWIEKRHPVISGNATFYCQPTELLSPTSNMLRSLKKERSAVKHMMFNFKPGSAEYMDSDLDQQNKKVIMNAEYGGSGTPTAAFYSKYNPAATTLMAQSIITTMAAFFEGYIGDNMKIFSLPECIDWMNDVLKKTEKIPKWVRIPTVEQTANRIKWMMYMPNVKDFPIIDRFIRGCTEEQRTYLYYANNLKTFISNHPRMQSLLSSILHHLPNYEAARTDDEIPAEQQKNFPPEPDGGNILKYNRWMSQEMFLNPYKPPKTIQPYVDELAKWMNQFIYVEYITPDSVEKLNNHMRNTVLLVDTDSNILNADIFVQFVLDEIFPGETFGRSRMYNDMICVNILAYVISIAVANMLDYYGRCHNMDEASRAELSMKNEFMFRRFFLMQVKKRYAASIVLREGNIIYPFKPEIKGLDFIKAGVTDRVTKKFQKMLEEHILFSDELELHELMDDLKEFERQIYRDLRRGGREFCKQQIFKPEQAFKAIKDKDGRTLGTKAWSMQVFRGSMVWNELYPEQKIYPMDRVAIVKLISQDVSQMAKIQEQYPEWYQKVIKNVYQSTNPDIQKAGMRIICIPPSVKQIPEWILPLIDYEAIISDVVSSFKSILEALHIEGIEFKTPNGKANTTSCLISL